MSVNSAPTQAPQIGEKAPDIQLLRADGNEFALSQLWQDGPAVLVFLRHLGCMFCREHVGELKQDRERFEELGAVIALITFRPPEEAATFCASRDVDEFCVCLSDPDKAAYRAYGLGRGSNAEMFTSNVVTKSFRATLHGYFAGIPKGDPYQMPGVFIVDRAGILRYAHRNKDIADNPPNQELLDVLAALTL